MGIIVNGVINSRDVTGGNKPFARLHPPILKRSGKSLEETWEEDGGSKIKRNQ